MSAANRYSNVKIGIGLKNVKGLEELHAYDSFSRATENSELVRDAYRQCTSHAVRYTYYCVFYIIAMHKLAIYTFDDI